MELRDTERIEQLATAVNELLEGKIPLAIPFDDEWNHDLNRLRLLLNQLIEEVRRATAAVADLAQGNIECKINGSLITTLALKELRRALRHLSRETAGMTSDDFGQSAAYLREFSESFSTIVRQLTENRDQMETLAAGKSRELEEANHLLEENQHQRIETENLLNQTEGRLRTVIEASTDAIIAIDSRGIITIFNPAAERMFGFASKEVTGSGINVLIPEKLRDHHETMVNNYFLRGMPRSAIGRTLNLSAAHRDGSTFPIELSLSEGCVNDKKFVFAMIRDITDRIAAEKKTKELQKRLERAERMQALAVLAGGVAHDLNNELGPLVGYPELILDKLAEDDPSRKHVLSMQTAAQRAASTIQDLLTLARRGRYGMTPTSVNDVITTYLDSPHCTSLKTKNPDVSLRLELDDSETLILGSAPHLSKVIMNLVGNAFDAMPAGGEVHIQTSHQHLDRLFSGYDQLVSGEYVLLRVRDTGMGIDPEDIEKIFEPYFSRKEMGASGTGLGLAVVYGIVKDHDGFYDVFSEKGKSTEFVIYFPITCERHPVELEKRVSAGGTESVLVIDDAATQRELATEFLTSGGYKVTSVPGSTEALEHLSKNAVDIAILDMIISRESDGLDTFNEMREIRPDLKVVIVSGSSQSERVREMQRLGAGDYVGKPYAKQQLLAAVRKELDRRPSTTPAG